MIASKVICHFDSGLYYPFVTDFLIKPNSNVSKLSTCGTGLRIQYILQQEMHYVQNAAVTNASDVVWDSRLIAHNVWQQQQKSASGKSIYRWLYHNRKKITQE